ncbi:hypothetical protein SALBM217S_04297 [Streptomyces griseoloalbus]
MSLRQYEYALAVAEEGSVTAAAERLRAPSVGRMSTRFDAIEMGPRRQDVWRRNVGRDRLLPDTEEMVVPRPVAAAVGRGPHLAGRAVRAGPAEVDALLRSWWRRASAPS